MFEKKKKITNSIRKYLGIDGGLGIDARFFNNEVGIRCVDPL